MKLRTLSLSRRELLWLWQSTRRLSVVITIETRQLQSIIKRQSGYNWAVVSPPQVSWHAHEEHMSMSGFVLMRRSCRRIFQWLRNAVPLGIKGIICTSGGDTYREWTQCTTPIRPAHDFSAHRSISFIRQSNAAHRLTLFSSPPIASFKKQRAYDATSVSSCTLLSKVAIN